ncbi:serine/threonine-protein kinase [Flexivirga meconopsidis]|uniref:serine/threonine-protein kinase n=1 Tax=Flexivirga meconopsidis TaxID=2977121 RepID=UPI00224073D9|nr:serine/threonine protein kinase [Flexivirga meconopsidis]
MTADRRADAARPGAGSGTHRLPTRGPDSYNEAYDDPTVVLPPTQQLLGNYRLIGRLGEGGMGVVYKGLDVHGDPVAVKVLRDHIAHDAGARERLRREVSTLVRVKSPNVASFLDAEVDGERPYLVTSFVPGAPLDEVVEEDGPFGAARLARLGRGLADALGAIHAAGIVHRDLKPGNVLLVGDDPVLIDFGIAHVADDARLTSTGLVMGTPGYLSPEIVEGAEVTQATDWWGWAATLAYAASGQPPFGRGPMTVVLDRVSRGQADLTGVEPRLRPLLQAALNPDPAARPAAQEVLAELDVFASGGQTGHIPMRATKPPTEAISRPTTFRQQAAPVTGKPATAFVPSPRSSAPDTERLRGATPGTERLPYDRGAGQRSAPVGFEPREQRRPQPSPQGDRPVPSLPPGKFVPPPDPRIGQPARTGTLAALAAAAVGITALWPTVGFVLVVLWAIAARWCDKTVTSMVLRRFSGGRRKSDGFVAAVTSPWHGVLAALATVLTVLIPAFVGACAAAVVALAWSMTQGGSAYLARPAPLGVGMLIALLVMWWGPGGIPLRRGSRSIVRGVIRGKPLTQIIVGVLIAIAIICGLWALTHLSSGANWWPFQTDSSVPMQGVLPNLPGR